MTQPTGMGQTFNLPNYHGELINITPADTPLLSLSGGLSGGQQTTSPAFEWQTESLRDPQNADRIEGDDAPTATSRPRSNVENVVQIFHESIVTSYTKQAATGQYATPGSAPFYSADGSPNPINDEHAHQVELALRTLARDVNYTFWHGEFAKPTVVTNPRKTAGLLSVVSGSNRMLAAAGVEITGLSSGASNIISETATALANGDAIVFTAPPAELRPDRVYYVVNKATDSFKVASTPSGTALTVANSQSGIAYVTAETALNVDTQLNALMQIIFDAGGISEQGTATIFASSRQKRALTAALKSQYATDPYAGTRDVAGNSVETIRTDFGTLNVVVERALPPDALAVVSLEQVAPVFLNIPGKGVLFEEALAKTGASEKSQIYGEIGLKYGYAAAHGVIRGLAV